MIPFKLSGGASVATYTLTSGVTTFMDNTIYTPSFLDSISACQVWQWFSDSAWSADLLTC